MVYEADRPSTIGGSEIGSSSSNVSAGYGLLDDVVPPPSYDSVTESAGGSGAPYVSPSQQLGSSSAQVAGPSTSTAAPPQPADTFLFVGPPNSEPLMSREQANETDPGIKLHESFSGKETLDPQLEDPDALYDFCRRQAVIPPQMTIRCRGTHQETAQCKMTVMENGHARTVESGHQYQAVDFDFTIDATPVYHHAYNLNNVHLTARPAYIPAKRGTFSRVLGAAHGLARAGRVTDWTENRMWNEWSKYCKEHGRPPWANIGDDREFWAKYSATEWAGFQFPRRAIELAGGSRRVRGPDEEALLPNSAPYSDPQDDDEEATLKQWCEAYCADQGLLKSFTLDKIVWGWDLQGLDNAIRRAILSTGYQPSGSRITVDITTSSNQKLIVRPNNWLTRALGNTFVFILLCITLIYPVIWIWQRLSPRGGAPYEVATVTYAQKFYPPLPGTFPNETIEQARHRLASLYKLHIEIPKNVQLVRGPKGVHYLLGRREGEWFRSWEEIIRMGVRMRYHGELVQGARDENEEPPLLDGY